MRRALTIATRCSADSSPGPPEAPTPTKLAADIAELHRHNNTFPGEVLMELAADALDLADYGRERRVEYRTLLTKHLAEVELRGKQHRRIQYAVLTAFALHGGLEPDLLDEVTYWIEQDQDRSTLLTVPVAGCITKRHT